MIFCLLLGNELIGPFIFNTTLNGERYLHLLRNEIIPAIRQVVPNDENFGRLWFQQDGCPAHNTAGVRLFLRQTFGEQIISLNGPVAWPARSPDLSPLDFYLWGHAKNEVYVFDPPENVDALRHRVIDVFHSINRNTLRRVIGTILTNCQKCHIANGQHFAHLPDN